MSRRRGNVSVGAVLGLLAVVACSLPLARPADAQISNCGSQLMQQTYSCQSPGCGLGEITVWVPYGMLLYGYSYNIVYCCTTAYMTYLNDPAGCLSSPASQTGGTGRPGSRLSPSVLQGSRSPLEPRPWQPLYVRDCHGDYDLVIAPAPS